MKRTVAAFLVAPLCMAAVFFLLPGFQERVVAPIGVLTAVISALIVAYAVVLVVVLPPFLVLRAFGYTSFWVALAQGAVTATLIWIVSTVVRVFGRDFEAILDALKEFALVHPMRLLLLVSIGAAELTVIWLIARPDLAHSEKLRRAKEATEANVF